VGALFLLAALQSVDDESGGLVRHAVDGIRAVGATI
jgi:hypothetical protein